MNDFKDEHTEKENSNDYTDGYAALALIAIVVSGVVIILLNI